MTPLEHRIKWGLTPNDHNLNYDADSDDQYRAQEEEAREDIEVVDTGLRKSAKGEVSAKDALQENKENEDYEEHHGNNKNSSPAIARSNEGAKISNAEESDEVDEVDKAGVLENDGSMCPVGGQLVNLFADSE
ncbi:hypothetical protein IFR05_004173 [Cadophora sp. M221]|nr:hypothetical protein IFR05_004173 [Cadophora sp. M221]